MPNEQESRERNMVPQGEQALYTGRGSCEEGEYVPD